MHENRGASCEKRNVYPRDRKRKRVNSPTSKGESRKRERPHTPARGKGLHATQKKDLPWVSKKDLGRREVGRILSYSLGAGKEIRNRAVSEREKREKLVLTRSDRKIREMIPDREEESDSYHVVPRKAALLCLANGRKERNLNEGRGHQKTLRGKEILFDAREGELCFRHQNKAGKKEK